MRWRFGGWVALCLTTGCTDFIGADTGGAVADSGASGTVAEVSTGDLPGPASSSTSTSTSTGMATPTAFTTSSSTSTTDASNTSTGPSPETTDASETTRGTDATTSESTGATPTCKNRVFDGDETDLDCGGSCTACDLGEGCGVGTDCTTGFCAPSSLCSLQDPQVWLDALDPDTLYNEDSCTDSPATPGQQVHCWANKGSHGGFFVDDGSQPIYQAASNSVEFDNTTMLSTDPVFVGSLGDVTVFLVQQETSSHNSFDFNLNHPSENGNRYSTHIPWGNSNRRVIFDIGGSGGAARIQTMLDLIAVGETHAFTFVNSEEDDERLIRIDGGEEASAVGSRSADAGVVSIGNGSRVLMHEFRVYSPSPTAAARELIEGQLACRWDLRDQLPATHPFYDANSASDVECPPPL